MICLINSVASSVILLISGAALFAHFLIMSSQLVYILFNFIPVDQETPWLENVKKATTYYSCSKFSNFLEQKNVVHWTISGWLLSIFLL